jgi:hypothetical protein
VFLETDHPGEEHPFDQQSTQPELENLSQTIAEQRFCHRVDRYLTVCIARVRYRALGFAAKLF